MCYECDWAKRFLWSILKTWLKDILKISEKQERPPGKRWMTFEIITAPLCWIQIWSRTNKSKTWLKNILCLLYFPLLNIKKQQSPGYTHWSSHWVNVKLCIIEFNIPQLYGGLPYPQVGWITPRTICPHACLYCSVQSCIVHYKIT